jgi:hypothetical protein
MIDRISQIREELFQTATRVISLHEQQKTNKTLTEI